MDLYRRAARRYRNDGLVDLIVATTAWAYRHSLRRWLPPTGFATRNGVKVQRRRLFDDRLPSANWYNAPDVPGYEQAIVDHHERTTEPGDDVVIVGGGYGVSMVAAARAVEPTGSVVVYEASERQVSLLDRIAAWNDVAEVCDVRAALVAHDVNVYPGSVADRRVDPADIEPCDVLELDCEGAEERILPALSIRPDRIVLELHPNLMDGDATRIVSELVTSGYRIDQMSGHDGASLSWDEFEAMLAYDSAEGREDAFDARYPPVVLARRVAER